MNLQVITSRLPPFLAGLILRAKEWWHPSLPPPPPEPDPPIVEPPPPPPPAVVKRRERDDGQWDMRRQGVEDMGTFYFRRDILDQLEKYFRAIKRFRLSDRDSYDLYARVGGTVLPGQALSSHFELPAFWNNRKTRPGFGCILLSGDSDAKYIHARFSYFQKMTRLPPTIERVPADWDVYQLCLYYDDETPRNDKYWARHFKEHGFCSTLYIGLNPAGETQLLKELQVKQQRLPYRGATSNGSGKTRKKLFAEYVPYTQFDYPESATRLFNDVKKSYAEWNVRTVNDYARTILAFTSNWGHANESGIRVDVIDDNGNTASFAVDWKRTAYFFKDRETTVLANDGRRARIFHIVRPHQRVTSSKITNVPMHFRGLRKFVWNGYNVSVSVPGLHHTPMAEFTPAAVYGEVGEPLHPGHIPMDVLARKLAEHVHEGKRINVD